MKLLDSKLRVPREFARVDEYPNRVTLESIEREIRDRVDNGMSPIDAFLTVADGVRNWNSKESA